MTQRFSGPRPRLFFYVAVVSSYTTGSTLPPGLSGVRGGPAGVLRLGFLYPHHRDSVKSRPPRRCPVMTVLPPRSISGWARPFANWGYVKRKPSIPCSSTDVMYRLACPMPQISRSGIPVCLYFANCLATCSLFWRHWTVLRKRPPRPYPPVRPGRDFFTSIIWMGSCCPRNTTKS